MIVGLVGLHGSGKSHLSHILEKDFGWTNANKRKILEGMFSKNFSSPESQESIEWYRHMYKSYGVSKLTELILEALPKRALVILDAIHNPVEWLVVKNTFPTSMLAGVFSPQIARSKRNSPQDAVLDIKRIGYWHDHSEERCGCLLSEVEWAFTGVNSPELQKVECEEFMNYLRVSGYLD